MSTQAYVSGRLGKALIVDHGQRWVIEQDGPQREASLCEVSDLFSDVAEVKGFSVNTTDAVRAHLSEEILFQDALFLFLSGCDPDLSLSTRIICGQELESLLEGEALAKRLMTRLLSKPMPAPVRACRHETISLFASFSLFSACLRRVFGLQEWCDEVYGAWKEAARSFSLDLAAGLESELIEDGTVASIVEALSSKQLHTFNAEFVSQSLRHRDPSVSQMARDALLDIRDSLRPQLSRGLETQRVLPLKRRNSNRSVQSPDVIAEAIQRGKYGEGSPRLSPFEAKTRVDKQIGSIANEFFSGREDLAEKYIADLVHFQFSNSEQEHLAKSLCNLAATALDANRLEMADKLSRYAVDLGIDDPVVFTTRAEVLKNLGSFDASLEAFREAKLRFPNSEYAWVGIADVLNELGKHESSLAAYNEAQEKFSDSPVPFNGYVSVLRAEGKRRMAIEYALKVVQRFPNDAVSRSSLALALRDRGKYSDAVRQYQAALRLDGRNPKIILGYLSALCLTSAGSRGALEYLDDSLRIMPDNVSLLNARANYLRRAGLFTESLTVAEGLISDHPMYTPAKFSCAATLVIMGRTQEAEQILPATQNLRSELDWLGPRIYALSLAADGHFAEADERLKMALESCPWRKEQSRIRTTLGYVQMKLGRSADSVLTLERDLMSLDDGTKQLRLVLLGHAQAIRGNYTVANTLLTNMVSTKDHLLVSLRKSYLASLNSSPAKGDKSQDNIELQLLLAA